MPALQLIERSGIQPGFLCDLLHFQAEACAGFLDDVAEVVFKHVGIIGKERRMINIDCVRNWGQSRFLKDEDGWLKRG